MKLTKSKYSFPKYLRLNRKKDILFIAKNGNFFKTEHFFVKWIFFEQQQDAPLKVLISVSKKIFKKATKRNLIKRRTKEAFRLNKNSLLSKIPNKKTLGILISYRKKGILADFSTIEKEIIFILDKILSQISL